MTKMILLSIFIVFIVHDIMGQPRSKKTDFGNYFKSLYRKGDFKTMMLLTSAKSIKQFGYDKILNFYKSMDFNYEMHFKSFTQSPGNLILLNYKAKIPNEKKTIQIITTIENDTTKLVIDNILFNLGINLNNIDFTWNKNSYIHINDSTYAPSSIGNMDKIRQ